MKPICFKCQKFFIKSSVGAVAELVKEINGFKYQQFRCDIHTCPGCAAMIAVDFGNKPSWEHFQGLEARETEVAVTVVVK